MKKITCCNVGYYSNDVQVYNIDHLINDNIAGGKLCIQCLNHP